MRKKFEEAFKARVAIEAIKCEKTLSQISSEYGVHSNLVSRWKQELLKGAADVFGKPNNSSKNGQDELIDNLYKSVGQLKVENDWLKKKLKLLG